MNSNRKILRKGSIYIENNKIVEVDKSDKIKNKSAEITIEAKNKLILPGYVNVHTHLPSIFVRGVYGVVAKGLTSVLFPLKTYFTPEDMHLFGLVSCIEALHGGSTTIAENYNYLDSFALAVKETGIRAVLGEQIAEADLIKIKDNVYKYNPEQAEAALDRAKKLIKKWHKTENGRITTNVAPLAPDMTTYETYQKCKEISETHNIKLTTHLSQSEGEVQQVKKKYGVTPPEFLDKLGLLNENTLCAHCSYITDKDRMKMSKNSVSVLHCPRPYAAGGRTNPLVKLLEMGMKVGLATDNVFHSMNETMRVGLFASRIRSEFIGGSNRMDRGTKPGYLEMLELATIRGAEVLGIEKEVGSIESGKKADIIMYDLTNPHLQPTMEPISSVVLYGTSGDIDTVLVDGKIIKKDLKIQDKNVASIVEKSQERVIELWGEFFNDYPESKKLWESYLPY